MLVDLLQLCLGFSTPALTLFTLSFNFSSITMAVFQLAWISWGGLPSCRRGLMGLVRRGDEILFGKSSFMTEFLMKSGKSDGGGSAQRLTRLWGKISQLQKVVIRPASHPQFKVNMRMKLTHHQGFFLFFFNQRLWDFQTLPLAMFWQHHVCVVMMQPGVTQVTMFPVSFKSDWRVLSCTVNIASFENRRQTRGFCGKWANKRKAFLTTNSVYAREID